MNIHPTRAPRRWVGARAALLLVFSTILPLVAPDAAGQTGATANSTQNENQRRLVIQQKLRLLESILASPRARQAQDSGDPESKAHYAKVRRLMEGARAALASGDAEFAGQSLDEALRTVSGAAFSKNGSSLNVSAQRTRNAELLEQIRSYRGSLADAAKENNGKTAGDAVARLDRLVAEADKHSASGRYAEANKLLAEAYKLAVTAVTEIRAGQTVVLRLKFDTPADEFAYEQRRNRSHEMLIDMMIAEGRAEGPKRNLVERYVEESRSLRAKADGQAKAGDYASAVKTLEQATSQLVRALQVTGLAVF